MNLLESNEEGVYLIEFKEPGARLDVSNFEPFQQRLLQLLAAGHRSLLIDLSHLVYISSAGLKALLTVAKQLKQAQAKLVLCSMGENVRQVVEIAGFHTIFQILPDRSAAIQALKGP